MSKKKTSQRWVIGIHSVYEALKTHPNWVNEVLLQEDKSGELDEIEKLCQKNKFKYKTVGRKTLSNLADGHQGVAAAMKERPEWDDNLVNKEKKSRGFSRWHYRPT